MLVDIARFAREHHALTWKARSVVATAEGLLAGHRELLEETIGREVFDSYGSREVMNIASECEQHQGMHMATDNLRVEVVDASGVPVPAGTAGRVVVTDFHNAASPFIRYEVGDIATLWPDEPCRCGRPFARLATVEGRIQEVVQTPGGPITMVWFSISLKVFDWMEGFQIVQNQLDRITLRIKTKRELTPELTGPVSDMLHTRLGNMRIDFERVDELSRRPTGKAQLLVSSLDPTSRAG
jgi:phenylacetate-CoA ligase